MSTTDESPATFVHPVDRDLLPPGKDWMLIEEPGGAARLVVARDSGEIRVPLTIGLPARDAG